MSETSPVHFVKVGQGRLALYHRPRRTDFEMFRALGCTHLVTLLKDSEGAERYGNMARNAGIEWIWLSVPNGKYPEGDVHERLLQAMPELSKLLDDGKSLLIHCSAGIHRTGMVAYGLLRWHGLSRAEAVQVISQARRETVEGMMEKRMRWGDENARTAAEKESSWLNSVKEFANRWVTTLSRSR